MSRISPSVIAAGLVALAPGLLLVAGSPAARAQSGAFSGLDARTSVFSSSANALGSTDNSSLASLIIAINPGTNRVLTFSNITGSIDPANTPHGADGGTYDGNGVNINSLGSISGVLDTNDRTLALMGVFTSANPATGAAPARIDFSGNHAFASLTPLLNQSFFIGDGLTGTGSGATQQFFVPNGAAFLQLGYADAFVSSNTAFVGDPSAYGDNHGTLSGNYRIAAVSAPEPGALPLLATGLLSLAGVVAVRRRRGSAA